MAVWLRETSDLEQNGDLARETSDRQPTNASRVGSISCSVRAKRRKMEGAHRDSNLFYYCLY